MSIEQFDTKESYTGTGSLATYSFDFKITELTHLLVVVADASGVEVQRVRGDNIVFLSSVTFDPIEGGGSVILQANLPSGYTMLLLLANDQPLQEYRFRDKTSFTLRRFEDALDAILGAVQRLVYQAAKSLRLHDLDDETTFNPMFPAGISNQAGRVVIINTGADGFDYGPTSEEVANAEQFAEDASDSADAAETARIAAEAAQAAAEAAAAGISGGAVVPLAGASGSLSRGEHGIITSGSSYALDLDNTGLVAGDVIEVKTLGIASDLTVTPTGENIDGAAFKILPASLNANWKFKYIGASGWILT